MRCFDRPVLALGDTGAHERHAHAGHDRLDVGEVDVDLTRYDDQITDALDRLTQDVVGDQKGFGQRRAAVDEAEQPLIGNGDQGIDRVAQLLDAAIGEVHPPPALKAERFGDHRHRQRADLGRQRREDRRRATAGAAAEASGQEHHVGAVQDLEDTLGIFERRLATDVGVAAGPQSTGQVVPELQLDRRFGTPQSLDIGVGADELDAAQLGLDHAVHRVATAAADSDDLDLRWRLIDALERDRQSVLFRRFVEQNHGFSLSVY